MSSIISTHPILEQTECQVIQTSTPVKKKYIPKKCEHEKIKIRCLLCKGSQVCIHNKRKDSCSKCKGDIICPHNIQKNNCIQCKSIGFCCHNKLEDNCVPCKGKNICCHNKLKENCVPCKGKKICIHDKRKDVCIECKSASICSHNKLKYFCVACKGSRICPHNKIKQQCGLCRDPSTYCQHDKVKRDCKLCKGSRICQHDVFKRLCRVCNKNGFCIHDNKLKSLCKICDGKDLCKSSWCETRVNRKYDGYCAYCYFHLFPDKQISRNYKTKEKDVVDRIKQFFPNFTWIADKRIQDGCSKRRPDLLLDMGSHIIIVEIDENRHTDYDCSCQNKRLMELSLDVGHRPIVFIRFNPDDYKDTNGVTIKSCWKLNKLGIMSIIKNKHSEWDKRIDSLKDQIQYWIDNKTEKTVEIVELFY